MTPERPMPTPTSEGGQAQQADLGAAARARRLRPGRGARPQGATRITTRIMADSDRDRPARVMADAPSVPPGPDTGPGGPAAPITPAPWSPPYPRPPSPSHAPPPPLFPLGPGPAAVAMAAAVSGPLSPVRLARPGRAAAWPARCGVCLLFWEGGYRLAGSLRARACVRAITWLARDGPVTAFY